MAKKESAEKAVVGDARERCVMATPRGISGSQDPVGEIRADPGSARWGSESLHGGQCTQFCALPRLDHDSDVNVIGMVLMELPRTERTYWSSPEKRGLRRVAGVSHRIGRLLCELNKRRA
jgi:hypothetical protein